jgi:hypothetical protein
VRKLAIIAIGHATQIFNYLHYSNFWSIVFNLYLDAGLLTQHDQYVAMASSAAETIVTPKRQAH